MATMIECNVNGIRCENIQGTNLAALYYSQKNGSIKIHIFDYSKNKYIAKGILTPKEAYNVQYDKENYTIDISGGKVSVVSRNPDSSSLDTSPAGTYYTTNVNGQDIAVLVLCGVAVGVVVASVVYLFTKFPPVSGSAGLGAGEIIGGAEAASKIGNILNKLVGILPSILIPNRTESLEHFTQAQSTSPTTYIDPIIIDLNNDGKLSTTTIDNGTYFDHQNDGFAETSAWVSPNDGILAIDKNNNGYIDNGNEIFGDNYNIISINFWNMKYKNNLNLNVV